MFAKTKLSTPQNEIGEIVPVLAGNLANEVITTTQGKFIRTGAVYNKADYPELYAKIGPVGSSAFNTVSYPFGTEGTMSCVYGNGKYVFGGGSGITGIWSTTDFVTFSGHNFIGAGLMRTTIYGNGNYVVGSANGGVFSSTDAVSWTGRVGNDFGSRSYTGVYGNGIYLIGNTNSRIFRGNGIASWSTVAVSEIPAGPCGMTYGNGNFYYCAMNSPTIYTSTNGSTWTSLSLTSQGFSSAFTTMGYGNGLFILGGASSVIATSTDAITWTRRNFGISGTSPRCVLYENGRYFVGCDSGILRTSTDGITWTGVGTLDTTVTVSFLSYGNGRYFYVGGGAANAGTHVDTRYIGLSNTAFNIETSGLYDINTQFYVPAYNEGSRLYTLPTYGSNTAPRYVGYIRAK